MIRVLDQHTTAVIIMSGGMFALLKKKREKENKMKELRESFAKADKDGDGALNQEEWLEVMRDSGMDIKR